MTRFQTDGFVTVGECIPPTRDNTRPAVLLLSGLGRPSGYWPLAFRFRLSKAGYRVLTLDNRDSGSSTHLTPPVNLGAVRRAVAAGLDPDVPYHLSDMADDAIRFLDHMEVEAAHVIGISMGGMIAQTMAITHPSRVLSLTSMMSTTGNPEVGRATPEGERVLFHPPATAADAVAATLEARRTLATPGTFDPTVEEYIARTVVAPRYDAAGIKRQLAAIWASGDRTAQLRTLDLPSLVVHGTADQLVAPSGGLATAAAIPDARLLMMEGMGHDLPPVHWGEILRHIIALADSVAVPSLEPRVLPADPNNAALLAELSQRAFADDKKRYGSGPPGFEDPATHRDLIARGHCHELWSNGVLVGALYMFDQENGDWGLGAIFIEPQLQRRGLGSQLMKHARSLHPWIKRIRLNTPYGNSHLHRFYESHGYRQIGVTAAGSHPEAIDPNFHLIEYQRDRWDSPWTPTDTETIEVTASLRKDIADGSVAGADTLSLELKDALLRQLDRNLAGLRAKPPAGEELIATSLRRQTSYARSLDGSPWYESGGSLRYQDAHVMLRRRREANERLEST